MTRAFAPSVAIGLDEAAAVMRLASASARSLSVEALLGLRAAEKGAVLSRLRLAPLAFLQLSRSTQIDDLSQRSRPRLFLAEGVDRHDFRFAARLGGLLRALRRFRAGRGLGRRFDRRGLCQGRPWSFFFFQHRREARRRLRHARLELEPERDEGSVKPVIESNGTTNRSGLREKFRLTSKASWVTARSQNSCWRMIDISSGKRCLTAGGATTPGAWVLNAILK